MGCGSSRLDLIGQGVPPRALLRRRSNSKPEIFCDAQEYPSKSSGDDNEKEGDMGKIVREVSEECLDVNGEVKGRDERMVLERDSSLSFRVYCSFDRDELGGFFNDEEKDEQILSTNEESVHSSNESITSSKDIQGSVKNPSKKGRRGRRLKRMTAKGEEGTADVKCMVRMDLFNRNQRTGSISN